MFMKTIKQTGYAILAVAALSIGGVSLATTAQAAPLHFNPIPATELAQDSDLIEVRSFRSHRGGSRGFNRGHRGRSFNRGHRSRSFNRGHRGRNFNRGHRSRNFNRGHGHGFKKHKFSRHGGFRF